MNWRIVKMWGQYECSKLKFAEHSFFDCLQLIFSIQTFRSIFLLVFSPFAFQLINLHRHLKPENNSVITRWPTQLKACIMLRLQVMTLCVQGAFVIDITLSVWILAWWSSWRIIEHHNRFSYHYKKFKFSIVWMKLKPGNFIIQSFNPSSVIRPLRLNW